MKNLSIRTKMLLGVILVNLIGMAVVAVYLHETYSGNLERQAVQDISISVRAWDQVQRHETMKLQAAADSLAANAAYRQGLAAGDRSGLLAGSKDVFEQLKSASDITHLYFERADGTVLLRVHSPEQFDDKLTRTTFVKASSTGDTAAGLDLGKTAVALRVVVPVTSGSRQVGFIETGQEIDDFVAELKELSGHEYALFLDKTKMEKEAYVDFRENKSLPNNWEDRENYVMVSTTNEDLESKIKFETLPNDVPQKGRVVGIENGACSKMCHGGLTAEGDFWQVKWSENRNTYAHMVFPIADVNGEPIGVVYEIEDVTEVANAARASLMNTLLVIVIGLILSTVAIAFLLQTMVFRRLDAMTTSMQDISVRVAGGDFDAAYVPSGLNDEIGKFEQFFAKFIGLMSNTLKSLMR